jgi:hypothetical protein
MEEERGTIGKLEFPLPECRDEFEAACHGLDLKCAMWDFDEWLRRKLKYEDPNPDEDILEAIREHFHECLSDHGIRLHD